MFWMAGIEYSKRHQMYRAARKTQSAEQSARTSGGLLSLNWIRVAKKPTLSNNGPKAERSIMWVQLKRLRMRDKRPGPDEGRMTLAVRPMKHSPAL
jgi:hypothetical protein